MEIKNENGEVAKVLVEKTSKRLKKLQLISVLVLVFGLVIMFAVQPILGALISTVGVVVAIYTKVQIWWQHE